MSLNKEQIVKIARTLNKTATAMELAEEFGVKAAEINSYATGIRKRGYVIPRLLPKQMLLDAVMADLLAEDGIVGK